MCGPFPPALPSTAPTSSSTTGLWATPSTSSATSKGAFAAVLRSAIRRSRSGAATRAARSTTARASTTTRTRTSSLSLRGQRLLELQDPPRHRDSRRVRRVHAPIAEPARAQGAGLRVGGVRRVVDDAKVEMRLGHVHALADRVPVGLADLVARIEVRSGLHLDHRVAALVVEVEVVAVLEEGAANRDRALVVEGRAVDDVRLHVGRGIAVVEPVRVEIGRAHV